jgi:hypothetical protein
MAEYPNGEVVWVSICDSPDHVRYIITSKKTRDTYFLYELVNGKYVKRGKGANPLELEERYVEYI